MSILPPKTIISPADIIKHKMQATGYTALDIAVLIGLGADGETRNRVPISTKIKALRAP